MRGSSPDVSTGSAAASTGSSGLAARSISAVLWGAGATGARVLIQVMTQVILARLLGPEHYGLFAAALLVVLFSTFFSDVGLAYGLIQRRTVDDQDIGFVFAWQTVFGVAVTGIVIALAPWVARFFGEPRLESLLWWLAPACLIQAMGATAQALLKRSLAFATVQFAQLVSYAVGFLLVGIPMALAGWKAEALVAAFLVQASLSQAILYACSRHRLRFVWWYGHAREALTFGATVLATNLLNWVMTSLDRAIISRHFQMVSVGLYANAHNLVNLPATTVIGLVQSVLYAASARVQDDPEKLGNAFRALLGVVCLLAAPAFAGIAVAAPTIVLALYGEAWLDAASVLVPLALAMPVYLAMAMAIPALWASGHARLEFGLQWPIALAMPLVLVPVAQTGSLVLLAWCVATCYAIRAVVVLAAALRVLSLAGATLLRPLLCAVILSGIVGACIFAVDLLMRRGFDAPLIWLFADMAAGAFALIAGLRLLMRQLDDPVLTLLKRLVARLPARLARWVHTWLALQP